MTTLRQDHPRMQRVQFLTTIIMALALVFWAYWTLQVVGALKYNVLAGGMQQSRLVDKTVEISFGQKTAFSVLWCSMILLVYYAFFAGLRLLNNLRKGEFFSSVTCQSIQAFGGWLVAAMVMDTILAAALPAVLSWANDPAGPIGYRGLSYVYDPGDISLLLCGLGFWAIGWVFHEGMRIAQENESFV